MRRRLSSPSQSFLSFLASAPARWWPSTLAPEDCHCNPSTRRVFRFAHASRYMAGSSGVEGNELCKPDRRLLIPSASDKMSSLAEDLAKELIARYGAGHHAISGDDDASRMAVDIIDSEHDTTGVVATGCKLSGDDKETWAAVVPCYPILPSSSHRDGSIYKGTNKWKEDYRIAERTERKL